jgi:hypothetical protein
MAKAFEVMSESEKKDQIKKVSLLYPFLPPPRVLRCYTDATLVLFLVFCSSYIREIDKWRLPTQCDKRGQGDMYMGVCYPFLIASFSSFFTSQADTASK